MVTGELQSGIKKTIKRANHGKKKVRNLRKEWQTATPKAVTLSKLLLLPKGFNDKSPRYLSTTILTVLPKPTDLIGLAGH